jgi:hypothetical protein
MAIADIFACRCIAHPINLPSRCVRRMSVVKVFDKHLAGQRHLAFSRGTDLCKERRQVSGGSDPTPAIRTVGTGLCLYGKNSAAL